MNEEKLIKKSERVLKRLFNTTKQPKHDAVALLEPNINAVMVIPKSEWAKKTIKSFATDDQTVVRVNDFFSGVTTINKPLITNKYCGKYLKFATDLLSVNDSGGVELITSDQWVLSLKNDDWEVVIAPLNPEQKKTKEAGKK